MLFLYTFPSPEIAIPPLKNPELSTPGTLLLTKIPQNEKNTHSVYAGSVDGYFRDLLYDPAGMQGKPGICWLRPLIHPLRNIFNRPLSGLFLYPYQIQFTPLSAQPAVPIPGF